MKLIKSYKKLITWAVILATLYFFVKTLYQNWHNLDGISLTPNLLTGLGIVFFVFSIISSGILWGEIITKLSAKKISTAESVRVHLASWLLKYIPGQAGSLVNKLAWGKKQKIDGKLITASFIYENVYLVLASTVPTIPILLFALSDKFTEGRTIFLPLLFAIPFILVVLDRRLFSKTINYLFRLLRKKSVNGADMFGTKANMKFFFKFIIPRILNGAAFIFIVESLINIEAGQYLAFGALYVLAGIIGVLAIFVPSGLGVREAVIVLFASAYIPSEQAIVLALVARFYATIADIVVAGLYFALSRKTAALQ